MIEVKKLTVKYKKTTALKDVSFRVETGDVLALVGQNGAGKSTLLKSIIGLKKIKSGTVKTKGTLGWMAESTIPDPDLTISEFLSFTGNLKCIADKDLKIEVDNVIGICGLFDKRHNLNKTLSKGLKQRVIFASAILGHSDILILDEPSAGLDPMFQKEMIKLIKDISIHKTVIISTHNIPEIEELATKIMVLKDGEISYLGEFKGEKSYYDFF